MNTMDTAENRKEIIKRELFKEVNLQNTILDEYLIRPEKFDISTISNSSREFLAKNKEYLQKERGKGQILFLRKYGCNGVQREHNKKLNNGLPILHKVPPKRDYGRYFCIMAEKGGTSHGGLTEKLSPFFHAKKQEVNAYGR